MKYPDIPKAQIKINGKTRGFDLDDKKLPDWISDHSMTSGGYPYDKKMKRSNYDEMLRVLQAELVKVQYWMKSENQRIICVFEGRDAAGKGGTIGAIKQNMNPRISRHVALSVPSDREKGQWYMQRYVSHFPTHGEMVLFDRSWYNRAGVEPVMGFCTPKQHEDFLKNVPDYEATIVGTGTHFYKFWLEVGQEMQLERFHDRRHDPRKTWKLSPMDVESMEKWDDYTVARDLMLEKTHTALAPWTIARTNCKRRARLNIIRHLLHRLDYEDKDNKAIGEIDENILGEGLQFLK